MEVKRSLLMVFILNFHILVTRCYDFSSCSEISNITLNCENSNCPSIPTAQQVNNTATVSVVNLAHNKITEVRAVDFEQAEEIDLSYNSIERVQDEAFASCAATLTRLSLAHNMIKRIEPEMFKDLSSLGFLDLSHNQIKQLQNEVFGFATFYDLRSLDVSHNGMSLVHPEALKNVHSLTELNLAHNDLDSENIGGVFEGFLLDLERIHLSNNKMTSLGPDFFSGQLSLIEADLSKNLIKNISSSAFRDLSQLLKIDLSWNQIDSLEPNTFNQAYLEDLYLDSNDFKEISATYFEGCTAKKLSLQGLTQLTGVKNGSFAGMKRLETIEISHCGILYFIDVNAFGMNDSTVKVADLSMNGLRTLAPETLPWEKVSQLDLSNNPWICDCGLDWVKKRQMNLVHKEFTKCASPTGLKNKVLLEIPEEYFICSQSSSMSGTNFLRRKASMLIGGLVVIGVLVVVAVGLLVWGRRRRILSQQTTTGYNALYNAVDPEDQTANVELTYTEKTKLSSKVPPPVDV